MNTLVRTITGQPLIHKINFNLSLNHVWVMVLSCGLFLSAFAIVYVKDVSRRFYVKAQMIENQNERLTERWSQLLLEQSTLTTQARIEKVARHRLQMALPSAAQVHLVTQASKKVSDGK